MKAHEDLRTKSVGGERTSESDKKISKTEVRREEVAPEDEENEKKLEEALPESEENEKEQLEEAPPEGEENEKKELEEAPPEGDIGRVEEVASAAITKELKKNSDNLWKCEDVPHSGWICTSVEDLGAPVGICEMCGYQIIRYVHHVEHPQYRSLAVGCVCAGRMEGDIEGAKRREAEFKNKQARHVNFLKRKWKRSKKGNEYLKIDGHIVVLYQEMKGKNLWKYSIDNEFCKA